MRLVELLKRLETFVFNVNLFSFTLEFYKSSRSVHNEFKKDVCFGEESFMSSKDSLPFSQKQPTNCILCQFNPSLIFIPHLIKTRFNNILPTSIRSDQ